MLPRALLSQPLAAPRQIVVQKGDGLAGVALKLREVIVREQASQGHDVGVGRHDVRCASEPVRTDPLLPASCSGCDASNPALGFGDALATGLDADHFWSTHAVCS